MNPFFALFVSFVVLCALPPRADGDPGVVVAKVVQPRRVVWTGTYFEQDEPRYWLLLADRRADECWEDGPEPVLEWRAVSYRAWLEAEEGCWWYPP